MLLASKAPTATMDRWTENYCAKSKNAKCAFGAVGERPEKGIKSVCEERNEPSEWFLFIRTCGPLNLSRSPFATKVNLCTFAGVSHPPLFARGSFSSPSTRAEGLTTPSQVKYYELKLFLLRSTFSQRPVLRWQRRGRLQSFHTRESWFVKKAKWKFHKLTLTQDVKLSSP